jgi:hypothetical protein
VNIPLLPENYPGYGRTGNLVYAHGVAPDAPHVYGIRGGRYGARGRARSATCSADRRRGELVDLVLRVRMGESE